VLDPDTDEMVALEEPYIALTGQVLSLTNVGEGDFFSFYSGETVNNQSYKYGDADAIGLNFSEQTLQYTYSTVGTFNIVVVSSGVGDYGEKLERDVMEVEIDITERRADFLDFSFHSVLPPVIEKGDTIEQIIKGIISDDVIHITVPYGTDPGSLVATFDVGFGYAYIGEVEQISGYSFNDYSSSVEYRIVSYDGSVEKTYIVTVLETPPSIEKSFLSFGFELSDPPLIIDAEIDEARRIVSAKFPFGVNLRQRALFSLPDFATAFIGETEQISGLSSNNFSEKVKYSIRAQDGSLKDFTVRINTEPYINQIKSFVFNSLDPPVYGNIVDNNISLTVSSNTDISQLKATFKHSLGSVVTVNGVLQESGVTINDFSDPVHYVVIGWDGTSALYTVTVIKN